MKKLYLLIFLCFSGGMFGQDFPDFTGSYKSFHTSYYDPHDPAENYRETTEFRILVILREDATGSVFVQDPRIPESPLIYTILKFDHFAQLLGNDLFIFNAESDRTGRAIELTFYYNSDGKLKLMLDDDGRSAAFHDLKSWDNPYYWQEFFKELYSSE